MDLSRLQVPPAWFPEHSPERSLTALSPLDGRYAHQLQPLAAYFSEYALIRYRLLVEVEYFLALVEEGLPPLNRLNRAALEPLRHSYLHFSMAHALRVKELEAITNHDVKALEYFIKELWSKSADFQGDNTSLLEFVHFGLTSQDVNNTATPLMLRHACEQVLFPAIHSLLRGLEARAQRWRPLAMLARTHGQPASPTSLGKEIEVFAERLRQAFATLQSLPVYAKFGGATGNLNAHLAAYPHHDWPRFANQFVEQRLGLRRSHTTTQIDHYDGLAALMDALRRVNVILIDLAQDVWLYVMQGYFTQRVKAGEVGSSAMPHKVNPIDFENAEGNLGLANALLEHLSRKLPISRLQRDLTDSTVLRNLGVPLGHTLLAVNSLRRGLQRLKPDPEQLAHDLDQHWEVLAEAVQTILRREGHPQAYELMKGLTRTGRSLSREQWLAFLNELPVSEALKQEFMHMTPATYTGTALGKAQD